MTRNPIAAMAFYHPHGLVPSWRQALRFAGEGGRAATLPDIIDARIADPFDAPSWRSYFTTASAEYYGLSRKGNPVLAVAHGIGPLATAEGCVEAYAKDREGRRKAGRVRRNEFWKLLDGHFGDVFTVDWVAYVSSRGKGMMDAQEAAECAGDAWMAARMGGEARAAAYIAKHARSAAERLDETGEDRLRPDEASLKVFENRMSYEAPYVSWNLAQQADAVAAARPEDPEFSHAHLLSVGGLARMHRWGTRHIVLASEASPHDWPDGTRFVGVRAGVCSGIRRGLNMEHAIRTMPAMLWKENHETPSFDLVIETAEQKWTAHPKTGESLDTGEPMCIVTHYEKIGEPVTYRKESSGFYGFFKYPISDIRRMAPSGANAYEIVGGPWTDGRMQEADIQFLRIEADRSRRMPREEEIYRDEELAIALAEAQALAETA